MDWIAHAPYSADGGWEKTRSLEDGIKILLENRAYEEFYIEN